MAPRGGTLNGADKLFPFLALPFSPFPKGGALGKEGKLFLYPLYSFALAIC